MSPNIGPLLHRAVRDVRPDPALAYRAIQGGRRSRRRRRATAAAAALAVAARSAPPVRSSWSATHMSRTR